ncbi:MAG: phosphocholine cytidylyltransferase family protein [Bacteroidaceae bacterium]|nr:phosphocholine cytidylyltransferase family protein [Bacteroidaceae bacterium]
MKAIILAAGTASRLRPLTDSTPKCLLKIGGRSLLQRSIDALTANGISEIVIVTGYLHEQIESFVDQQYPSLRVTYIYNKEYSTTNNIYSLWLARPEADGEDVLLLDSDLLYDPAILSRVMASSHSNVLTLTKHPLGEEEMKVVTDDQDSILEISKTCNPALAAGESLGIERMSKSYTTALYRELAIMIGQEGLSNIFYERAFERLIPQGHTFRVLDVSDLFSCELDTVEDFENASHKIKKLKN